MENNSLAMFYAEGRQKNSLFVVGHRSAVSFAIASDARRRSCIKYDSRGDVPRSMPTSQTFCLSSSSHLRCWNSDRYRAAAKLFRMLELIELERYFSLNRLRENLPSPQWKIGAKNSKLLGSISSIELNSIFLNRSNFFGEFIDVRGIHSSQNSRKNVQLLFGEGSNFFWLF